jgi:hypothetical protein
MSEVQLVANGQQVITARLEPNDLRGLDMAGQPALFLPLKLQLLPAGQKGDVQYTLLRLAGKLMTPPLGEFASFEVGPLAVDSTANPFYRQHQVTILLDRQRIGRFEDSRSGGNAQLQLSLSYLLWYPGEQKFETNISSGYLDVVVPKSHWAEQVVSIWNLSNIKVVEIKFSQSTAGESFRASYARVEEAEKLFANGQYKQVLTTLRLAFEALALGLGFEDQDRVKKCFESLFASSHTEKKEKARETLTAIYRFLHLGPHEHANHSDSSTQPVVTRQDARFALTLAYAIFEYIAPKD